MPKKTKSVMKETEDFLKDDCDERIAVEVEKAVKKERAKKEADTKTKTKRKPSAYNLFVKEHYKDEDVQALPPRERLGAIAKMWKAHKAK